MFQNVITVFIKFFIRKCPIWQELLTNPGHAYQFLVFSSEYTAIFSAGHSSPIKFSNNVPYSYEASQSHLVLYGTY